MKPRAALRLLVTVGHAGFSPIAPGTAGALLAFPLAWALTPLAWPARAAILAALTWAAVKIVDRYVEGLTDPDPSHVVIDELIGCSVALAFVPWRAGWAVAAFLLFRAFDIAKPGLIGTVDRHVHGGVGIVGDDVLAGIGAGVLLGGLHAVGALQGWWL